VETSRSTPFVSGHLALPLLPAMANRFQFPPTAPALVGLARVAHAGFEKQIRRPNPAQEAPSRRTVGVEHLREIRGFAGSGGAHAKDGADVTRAHQEPFGRGH